MPRAQYTDQDGLIKVVDVPDDVDPIYYPMGALIGPPDLADLELDRAVTREISNALVSETLLTALDIQQSGGFLKALRVLRKAKIAESELRETLRRLVSIYQREYYPAQFEGVIDNG